MTLIEEKFREIFKKQDGIVSVYFFGSRVKGNTDKFSDYDLAVLFRDGWKDGNRLEIVGNLLGDIFSVVGQDNADVVDLSDQPLWFQQVVVKTGKIIYEASKKKRLFYERELMRKCLQEGLPEYVEDGKMKKQDVQIKLDTIEENLEKLETLSHLDYNEFMADFRNLDAAMHELQTSIEALVDISRYVIRSLGLSSAEEYRLVPKILADYGYIARKDAEVYIEMARFRNLIVHHDHRGDPVEVYNIVKDNLDDIRRWRDSLVEIIESENN